MDNEIKIIVEKFDVDWKEIKNLCRGTIGMQDSKLEPNDIWKRKLLVAEHSVLRHSLITIKIENIPFAIMGHLVRHSVGVTPYVRTSREDRTGIKREERSQMDTVDMRMDLNIQSLINISRKRLCNQADQLTRTIWGKVVLEIAKYDEIIAWACVPEGMYRCGCSETFGHCNMCNNFIINMPFDDRINIIKRYDIYNKQRNKILKKSK